MQLKKSLTFLLKWISSVNVQSVFVVSNFITGLRILVAPFLYFSLLQNRWGLSFGLCIFAGFTDFLDGFLARKLNQTSFFGQIFDPLADKIVLTAIYIAFWRLNQVPNSLFYTILGRDMLLIIASIFVIKTNLNIPLHPLLLSKINTFFQFFLCVWIVSLNAFKEYSGKTLSIEWLTDYIIYITLILTILSGVQYAKRFFNNIF
jgi:cardiolipin synthase